MRDLKPQPLLRTMDGATTRVEPQPSTPSAFALRRYVVLALVVASALGLLGQAVTLNVTQEEFLKNQADSRHLRTVTMPAHRGTITDRFGEPLAISTPVDSVWVDPKQFTDQRSYWSDLFDLLELDHGAMERKLARRQHRRFVYLKRHVTPDISTQVRALHIKGVHLQREYRRYYPNGEVVAHIIGFTDVDDRGQEGAELAFEDRLTGRPGAKQVLQDQLGRFVEDVQQVETPMHGSRVRLSIDARLQSSAYQILKTAYLRHNAKGASLIVLDAARGEILAVVNQPSFNPNNRAERIGPSTRNRALTDVFEPGSTVKPFTVAAGLVSGRFHIDTPIDTAPGFIKVGKHKISDIRNHGKLDPTRLLAVSSNVGASRMALETPTHDLWATFSTVGFGRVTATGFPGESHGILTEPDRWGQIHKATLAYGYGLSVTALQLVRAYAVIANDGVDIPISMTARDEVPEGVRVLPAALAGQIRNMLEVVVRDGTGKRAAIPGYRVAGKTGTAKKSERGGYAEQRYHSLFAGIAPASSGRFVAVVVIDEPNGEDYYGGVIAAPVFAEVMSTAIRLHGIAPDDESGGPPSVDLVRMALHSGGVRAMPAASHQTRVVTAFDGPANSGNAKVRQ
jgi:cell division protein FtsI (penicillin-binding protein 3)